MLPISEEHAELLQTTHPVKFRVTAFYGGGLAETGDGGLVPFAQQGSLTSNGDANVQTTGTLFLAKDAASLVPKSRTDALAPYGQELRVDRVDLKGHQEFVTALGQFRIKKVPSMREYFRKYPNAAQMIGWSAQIELQDRFDQIIADEFLYPDQPVEGNSTWDEIQRLSPIPIVRNDLLPDVPVPSSLTAYPDSRMDALTTLFANLGAYPHLTRFGVLTGRLKDVWATATEPVFTINGVIDMDDSLSNTLYNAVLASSTDGQWVSRRQIQDAGDPLRVDGPLGRRVYKHTSPLYDSQESVDAGAETVLRRVSSRQSREVTVTCLPQPHLELGDYIRAVDVSTGREVDGEITGIGMTLKPEASWTYTLIAAETR